ncbi:MAG TPA: DUF2851 family protein [Ktedonobacterales bacterium]|nr:DUF2851 family protein [Ktedonobacterales bacterium]
MHHWRAYHSGGGWFNALAAICSPFPHFAAEKTTYHLWHSVKTSSAARPSATRQRESDLAARWAAGMWRGATLQTERGETYRVIFEGRRGGGAGPDFRDAVLVRGDGTPLYGDIELHLRPAGWYAHGHASDARYNELALHVVLTRGATDSTETALASGRTVPLVVLGDVIAARLPDACRPWPCSGYAAGKDAATLAVLLRAAGMARFAGHAAQFESALGAVSLSGEGAGWGGPDRALWLAMAEALGYGRDRAALRRLGQSLLDAPLAPLMDRSLPGVERMRARGLLAWHARWRRTSPWRSLEAALCAGDARHAVQALLTALRVAEHGAVSPGRAAIVAVNVVLPFAAALATRRDDTALASRARAVYEAWPSLPSNQIVREMARTLGLVRLPRGAAAQQGLHHLWQHTCREKQCGRCPCAICP